MFPIAACGKLNTICTIAAIITTITPSPFQLHLRFNLLAVDLDATHVRSIFVEAHCLAVHCLSQHATALIAQQSQLCSLRHQPSISVLQLTKLQPLASSLTPTITQASHHSQHIDLSRSGLVHVVHLHNSANEKLSIQEGAAWQRFEPSTDIANT